jgi:hypothetical protein
MSNPDNTGVSFSQTDIDAAVAKLAKSAKTFARNVETVLVMAVYDSIVNSSPAVANALIGALRASTKRQGIVAFLEKHGQLFNKEGKVGFVHFALGAQGRLAWTKDYVELVQEEAQGWESFKPVPPAAPPLDMVAEIQKLVKRHDAAAKNGTAIVDAELAPYLSALLGQYAGRKAVATAQSTAAPVHAEQVAEAREAATA